MSLIKQQISGLRALSVARILTNGKSDMSVADVDEEIHQATKALEINLPNETMVDVLKDVLVIIHLVHTGVPDNACLS